MRDGMVEVTPEEYRAFPGNKTVLGDFPGGNWYVDATQVRPVSEQARALADDIVEVMRKHGLVDDMAVGGIPMGLATTTLASAVVTAMDDCSPQYTRRNGVLRSFSREVGKAAESAAGYGVAADHSDETLLQRREADERTPGPWG